jgi:hypothetical protein
LIGAWFNTGVSLAGDWSITKIILSGSSLEGVSDASQLLIISQRVLLHESGIPIRHLVGQTEYFLLQCLLVSV